VFWNGGPLNRKRDGGFMAYSTDIIRNVALAGHGGTGKTTLFERALFAAGVIQKPAGVETGKTVSDFTPEEAERKISVHAALASFERKGKKINIFDTPGASDFTGEAILSFRSCESALLAVDAKSGVQIETIKLMRNLDGRKKPRAIVVTRLDEERADFDRVIEDIKEKFKVDPVPFSIPMGTGPDYKGVIDVLGGKAYLAGSGDGLEKAAAVPAEYQAAVDAAREKLIEAAAEGDNEMLEKYLSEGTLNPEDMHTGLIEAYKHNQFVPIFASSAVKNSGVTPLLDFFADIAPSPRDAKDTFVLPDGGQKDVAINGDGSLAALVVKTSYDQFSGKLSFVKVVTGKLSAESEIFNVTENKKERAGKLYTAVGKKLNEVKELCAGDIGIIAKSPSLKTNDTVSSGAALPDGALFLPLLLPEPVHSVAVNAVQKKDEDKLGEALLRAAEEDRTFRYNFDAETKETVISGMGELQINIILDKIKQNQKIEIETRIPKVAYRETITKKASAEHTHKKQTGGHGQYGRVVLDIAPLPRGEQYKFTNAIFGGVVSKGYIPGVEKGIAEAMARGTMAGYPVVDVEVAIVDGKEHPVDSSELAFKLAGRGAFRKAMATAAPTLLEPVMNLYVFVEEKYQGDVMSGLSGKRGKIVGQDNIGGGIVEIKAQAPAAELLRYSIDLRSVTSGTGSFSVEFSHYSPISGRIAEDVIKASPYIVQESDDE
jgi:elongation factor G